MEIWILVNDYLGKEEQLKRLDEYLEEKVKEVPNVEKLFAIKGVGLGMVIGFVVEVGDIGRFTDPKQIQKLAGLEIVKKSLGKRRGSRESARGAGESCGGQCMNLQGYWSTGIRHSRMYFSIIGTGRRIPSEGCRRR